MTRLRLIDTKGRLLGLSDWVFFVGVLVALGCHFLLITQGY
jgi:hypothetical protein